MCETAARLNLSQLLANLCVVLAVYGTLRAGDSILQLSGHGSVEEQMKAAVPEWQQMLCSTSGRPAGHPSCLIISPAALGAIAMIRSFPTFNQVCACCTGWVHALHAATADRMAIWCMLPGCVGHMFVSAAVW